MLKIVLVASAVIGTMGLSAPAALADAPTYDCYFDAVQQDDVTGQNYEGAAWGYAAHAESGYVAVRCLIRVNGSEAVSTPFSTGSGFAATAGPVSFAATPDDDVDICAEVATSHGTFEECFQAANTQVPPPEVLDAVHGVRDFTNNPNLCGLPPGHHPPVTIDQDGDVWLDSFRVVDCPPLDDDVEDVPDPPDHIGRFLP